MGTQTIEKEIDISHENHSRVAYRTLQNDSFTHIDETYNLQRIKKRFEVAAAVFLVLRNGNKILMAQRQNTGYRDGFFSLPAGHIEENEPAQMALIREVKEEIGIDIRCENIKPIKAVYRKSADRTSIDFFFTVDKWAGKINNLEPEKCSTLEWFDIGNLPNNTIPSLKRVLENLYDGVPIVDIGFGG